MEKNKALTYAKHFWCPDDHIYWQTEEYCSEDEVDGLKGQEAEKSQEQIHAEREASELSEQDKFNYYCRCKRCGKWCRAVPHYYQNISKMQSTGPRTDAGKRRSSLNGMKHGAYAQSHHLLAPANGKYDICHQCEQQEACRDKQLKYCPYKLDLMARFTAAYENGDFTALKAFAGLSQAKLYVILENMIQETMQVGVLLKAPKVHQGEVVKYGVGNPDSEGNYEEYQTVFEYSQNPLIDSLPKVMGALGMTSDQQSMNPAKRAGEDEEMKGKMEKPADPINFLNTMKGLMDSLTKGADAVRMASLTRSADPVHQEAVKTSQDDTEAEIDETMQNPFKR